MKIPYPSVHISVNDIGHSVEDLIDIRKAAIDIIIKDPYYKYFPIVINYDSGKKEIINGGIYNV